MNTTLLAADSRLSIVTTEDLTFDDWNERGVQLVRNLRVRSRQLRDARAAVESEQWKFGEWILNGDKKFGAKAYEVAEQLTGWTRETLYNVVWVVSRLSNSSLRSEKHLGWSHFKELARVKDEGGRQRVLEKVSDGFKWSVRDVRTFVDAELRNQKKHKSEKGETKSADLVYLSVRLSRPEQKLIRQWARARRKRPDELLQEIISKHLRKNKRKIAGDIARPRAKR